ncbi:hypothetical protein PAXRUDRAFT_165001, partial [Paxillus rubicundulus Ve08.2h10]
DVCSFLGLVIYLADHLPNPAEHSQVLTPLTNKGADSHFPIWNADYAKAFQAIKDLIVSPHCLTMVDYNNPGDNMIFLTCNASDF